MKTGSACHLGVVGMPKASCFSDDLGTVKVLRVHACLDESGDVVVVPELTLAFIAARSEGVRLCHEQSVVTDAGNHEHP